ncbi:MAG: hypothetical protein MR392_08855 [Roseburia sp.]|nr:hypothetical protein [Roseburia sp.]
MKDKIYTKEEYDRAIDCITQHIKIFHKHLLNTTDVAESMIHGLEAALEE